VALLSHDSGRVLGRTSSGTLTLRQDSLGLWFSLNADPTTPEGQTALGTIGRQDIKGCSFGFIVRAESWDDGGMRMPLRTVEDVDLFEITLTAFPAYETTSASLQRARANDLAARSRIAERKARMEQKFRRIR
jgi:HK97 family phage prohead protease